MKKLTTLLATLFVAMVGANAQQTESDNWAWGEKGWEYIGDAMEDTISLDFTTWTADSLPGTYHENAWYMNGSSKALSAAAHEDLLVEKGGIGFYKYCFYGERSLTMKGQTDAQKIPCLYTSGMSMDEAYIGAADSCFRNNAISTYKRPAIYIPGFKNGIKQIRITLAVNSTGRSFFNQTLAYTEDIHGQDSLYWKGIDAITANAGKGVYDEYVIEMDTEEETMATKVLSYASTDYPFILKLQVIPQKKPSSLVNVYTTLKCRSAHNGIILAAEENATVNVYNVIGATMATVNVQPGRQEFVALPMGIYIVDGNKIVVK